MGQNILDHSDIPTIHSTCQLSKGFGYLAKGSLQSYSPSRLRALTDDILVLETTGLLQVGFKHCIWAWSLKIVCCYDGA